MAGRHTEHGFTLVELLVVMVVIGVLAAIAIPVYLSQRDSAYRTEAVHDVRKTVTAIETWRAGAATGRAYQDLDGLDAAGLSAAGVEVSVGRWTHLSVHAADDAGYCLDAVHDQYPGHSLQYDKASGVIEVEALGSLSC